MCQKLGTSYDLVAPTLFLLLQRSQLQKDKPGNDTHCDDE